jgi:hypothetical protein
MNTIPLASACVLPGVLAAEASGESRPNLKFAGSTPATVAKQEEGHFNADYGLFEGSFFFGDGISGFPEPPFNPDRHSSNALDYPDALREVFTDGGAHEDAVPAEHQKSRFNVLFPRD